jgi:hypothetical protein
MTEDLVAYFNTKTGRNLTTVFDHTCGSWRCRRWN